MQRLYKSRIYYVLGYNNRIARIPPLLLGIRLSISEFNIGIHFISNSGEFDVITQAENINSYELSETVSIPNLNPGE